MLKFVESCCFGCRLNEEMIETLFMVNNGNSNMSLKDNGRRLVLPLSSQENRVLDPKKSQNIAILLRALNVTIEEVCEGLLEGNWFNFMFNLSSMVMSIVKIKIASVIVQSIAFLI